MSRRKITSISQLVGGEPTEGVKEMIGKTYTKLTVTGYAGYYVMPSGSKNPYVWCKCACGNELIANAAHIRHGNWISCGCYKKEHPSRFKHGFAPLKGKRDKIYTTWQSINNRCFRKKNTAYERYGAKGVTVCEGWRDFENFKKDMMPITSKSIDRIDSTKSYSCGHCKECLEKGWEMNCRWADDYEQSNNRPGFNRTVEINGKKMNHRDASRYLGFPEKTLQTRIVQLGWSEYDAINTPIGGIKKSKTLL